MGLALKEDGSAWTWGPNDYGELGDNTTTNKSSPVAVIGSHSFTSIHKSLQDNMGGLKSNGSIWCWGYNIYGCLGLNNQTNYSSPVAVVGDHSFTYYRQGKFHSMYLKEDGGLWVAGRNAYGQLGNNTNLDDYSSPVQVVGNHSFTSVGLGTYSSYGLKANGEVWSWGYNVNGCLGTNNITSYSSPVQVVGNHSFTALRGLNTHVACLKADSSVWTWGPNDAGQLGDGTCTNRSSPVAVVGSHLFSSIYVGQSEVLGLKDDGQLWGWGHNYYGGLGTNNRTSYSSPVQVVGNHTFKTMSGDYYAYFGLKNDGSMWGWGLNDYGQIGNNEIGNSYSSPVAVVGNHSFTKLFDSPEWTLYTGPFSSLGWVKLKIVN